ncbi:hypothetical protein M728_004018 (plasmid) [Ensifer sp. WSM1721]
MRPHFTIVLVATAALTLATPGAVAVIATGFNGFYVYGCTAD